MADFDVLIAGAGPAGCATAISLADFAPTLTTCLLDAGRCDDERIGETVPPPVKPVLDHLGLWPAFAADGHAPSYRTLSAWGGARLASNEFLFQTQQVGWRLDRARFDAMMLRSAVARGAAPLHAKVYDLKLHEGGWRVRLGDGTVLTVRAVVDATGRSAALARLRGVRPVRLDRLVGAFMYFDDPAAADRELIIEAVREGWWYTAALPGGRRVIALMTDADLARRSVADRDRWLCALAATEHIAACTSRARPFGALRLQGAGSQLLPWDDADTFLSVGDAASSFDPVSGQGIVKALRSAIFASYAIADRLERGDADGLRRYRTFIAAEFADYRRTLLDYYAVEQRWPDSAFWRRRHAASGAAAQTRAVEASSLRPRVDSQQLF